MRREIGIALALSLISATLAAIPCARATPAEIFGPGPRSQALAGAGATRELGYEAAFVNPAMLAGAEHAELTLGFHEAVFAIDVEGGAAESRFPAEPASGALVGLVAPLPVGKQRLALGLASRSPSDLIARADLPFPEQPQFPVLVPRAAALDLSLALAAALGDALSVGLGVRALASLSGAVTVSRAGEQSRTSVTSELTPAYATTAGAAVDLGEHWRVALAFRDALIADFDVDVRARDLGALALPELNVAGIAHYDPLQLQLEVSRAFSAWTVMVGATYERWSDFPGFLEATTSCPASRPDCAALPAPRAELFDTIAPRLAAAYSFEVAPRARAELRAGYAYEPTPMSVQVGSANTWDNSRQVLGVGYGLALSSPLFPMSIDAAYQLHALVSRTHEKLSSVPADNAGYPKVTIGGTVQSFALTLGVRF